jgi:hypothetical protein
MPALKPVWDEYIFSKPLPHSRIFLRCDVQANLLYYILANASATTLPYLKLVRDLPSVKKVSQLFGHI